jgi:hypothetical protein
VLLAACGGGGGGSIAPVDPSPLLATASIGPGGGSIVIATGDHAGVALHVQPGAVAVTTEFSIRVERDPNVPSLLPVYRFDPANVDFPSGSVGVVVRTAAAFFDATGTLAAPLTMFARGGDSEPFTAHVDTVVNEVARTLAVTPTRLGRFFASTGDLFRVFAQPLVFNDPATPTAFQVVNRVEVAVRNGNATTVLGRGSLASFWESPATDNLLVVHGLQGSPLDFRGPFDLVAGLSPAVKNIVFLTYPSGRGVQATANALYDLIRKNQRPGFGCSILGHSLGGNIGRYLVEHSHADTARPGFATTDAPLTDVVAKLILLGTPNAGSETAGGLFAALVPVLSGDDAAFVRAGLDLLEGPGTFTAQQNAIYVDNPTQYHVIAGDVGIGGDGIVTLPSARAVSLFVGETETVFPVAHFDLHRGAAANGVGTRIELLLQSP